jgi:hypothetical protein
VQAARTAGELASAIRHGDAGAVDRSQQELARLEQRPEPGSPYRARVRLGANVTVR